MPVADWFPAFSDQVCEVIPRPDWPALTSEFWAVVERAYVRDGVRHGAAIRALYAVAEHPPAYLDRVRTTLIEVGRAMQVQEANAQATDGGEMDRETAAEKSKTCGECGGAGMTSRFVFVRRLERYVSCGCICPVCPMGRWTARQWREEKGTKPFDLQDHPQLWDEALKYAPPGEHEEPEIDTRGMTNRELFESFKRGLKAETAGAR